VKEECPHLLAKWKERQIQKQNPNHNIHKIWIEIDDEGPKITIVIHGGANIGADAKNRGRSSEQWVRKST
jgi:hypothetical protein